MERTLNTIQSQLRLELNNINKEGLFKQERIIQSQQDVEITVASLTVFGKTKK